MARRGIPKKPPVWFLREWMETCNLRGRGAQARMMELTGWNRATMSQLYNGQQDFNSEILRTAAQALNIQEWELMMPPEMAMGYRNIMKNATQIVVVAPSTETHAPEEGERRTGTR